MRPTDLGVTAPIDPTAKVYYPAVTFDGRPLSTSPIPPRPTLSKSPRFDHYASEARKTGFRVGPGTYESDNLTMAKTKVRSTPVYKKLSGVKDSQIEQYYMFGDTLKGGFSKKPSAGLPKSPQSKTPNTAKKPHLDNRRFGSPDAPKRVVSLVLRQTSLTERTKSVRFSKQ